MDGLDACIQTSQSFFDVLGEEWDQAPPQHCQMTESIIPHANDWARISRCEVVPHRNPLFAKGHEAESVLKFFFGGVPYVAIAHDGSDLSILLPAHLGFSDEMQT